MTADTTSPLLQLLLQGTGNNPNSWGDNLNNNVILLLEQAVAGVIIIDVSGAADLVLTDDQSRNAVIYLLGARTADLTITAPNRAKKWTFFDATTGGFFVRLMVAGGGAMCNVPHNKSTDIWSSGNLTGALFRSDIEKIGNLFFHAGDTPPPGALACNNAAYKRASLVDLYAIIGVKYGSTDSTDFKVPPGTDTGRFLRSSSAGVAVGTLQSNQNKVHTHTASGTTTTESAFHTHTGSGNTSTESVGHTHSGSGSTSIESADHTHSGSGTTAGMNANAVHNHTAYLPGWSRKAMSFNDATGLWLNGAGNEPVTVLNTNTDHGHTYSFTTGYVSAYHTHSYSFTTSDRSAAHTHSFSFSSSNESAAHTHVYSFTTSSDGGSEARPESLVGLLCIWY